MPPSQGSVPRGPHRRRRPSRPRSVRRLRPDEAGRSLRWWRRRRRPADGEMLDDRRRRRRPSPPGSGRDRLAEVATGSETADGWSGIPLGATPPRWRAAMSSSCRPPARRAVGRGRGSTAPNVPTRSRTPAQIVDYADGRQVDIKLSGAPEYEALSVTVGRRLVEGARPTSPKRSSTTGATVPRWRTGSIRTTPRPTASRRPVAGGRPGGGL